MPPPPPPLPAPPGKSLCYQLPALLLPGVSLVVSPLLALMRDQLARLPPGVPGAMLWGGQTRAEAEGVLDQVREGGGKGWGCTQWGGGGGQVDVSEDKGQRLSERPEGSGVHRVGI